MSKTNAVDLFSVTDLIGIFSWFAGNKDKSQDITVKTVGGEKIRGPVQQVTAEYIGLSFNDQFAEGDFSGTIIPLRAVASVEFHLKAAGGSAGSEPPRTALPRDVA